MWVPRLDSDHQAWCHTPLPTEHHLAGSTVYYILITKYSKLIYHCGSRKARPFLLVLSLPFIRLKEPQQKLNTEIPKSHVRHYSRAYPGRQKANINVQYEDFPLSAGITKILHRHVGRIRENICIFQVNNNARACP